MGVLSKPISKQKQKVEFWAEIAQNVHVMASKLEYLKKYMSGDDQGEEKKKKKKKKSKHKDAGG